MKKFMTLAAIFAAATMSFSACSTDDTTPENNKQPETEQPGTEEPGTEEPGTPSGPVELAINIDGDFSDWDAIPAENLAVATCAEDAQYTALKVMKVCADADYINVYFEYDVEQVVDLSWTPIHIYVDADNSPETGGGDAMYTDADAEVMFEGVFAADGDLISWDPAKFHWWEAAGTTGWEWTEGDFLNQEGYHSSADNWGADIPEGSGIAEGAGVAAEGKYELQICKEMVAGVKWAETVGIGMDIQQNWRTVGQLPNASGEGVAAPKLRVTIAK